MVRLAARSTPTTTGRTSGEHISHHLCANIEDRRLPVEGRPLITRLRVPHVTRTHNDLSLDQDPERTLNVKRHAHQRHPETQTDRNDHVSDRSADGPLGILLPGKEIRSSERLRRSRLPLSRLPNRRNRNDHSYSGNSSSNSRSLSKRVRQARRSSSSLRGDETSHISDLPGNARRRINASQPRFHPVPSSSASHL